MNVAERERYRGWSFRTRVCCGLLASLATVGVILVNSPWIYETVSVEIVGEKFLPSELRRVDDGERVRRAGWPWVYQIDLVSDQGSSVPRFWSTFRLLADLAVGCLLVGAVAGWTITRSVWIGRSRKPSVARRRCDVATAACLLGIPVVVGWHAGTIANEHRRIAEAISSSAISSLSTEVPTFLVRRIPKSVRPLFARLRSIELTDPDVASLRQAMRVMTLRRVSIAAMRGPVVHLDRLKSMLELTHLQIHNCTITEQDCREIATCVDLRRLRLEDMALTHDTIRPIMTMPALRCVDLRRTGIRIASLGRPRWADNVEKLSLTASADATDDRLMLHGWPQLKELLLESERDDKTLRELTLDCDDLPRLKSLSLDYRRTHRFIGRNLPALAQITHAVADSHRSSYSEASVEFRPRFSELDLFNAPRIDTLCCEASHLKRLNLQSLPNLISFELGVGDESASGLLAVPSTLVDDTIEPARVRQWLQTLATIPSLRQLGIVGVPIEPSDLEPLRRCSRLRTICLAGSGANSAHLEQLCELKSLREIDLGDGVITSATFDRVMRRLPRLRELRADLSSVDQIRLVDNDQINILGTPEFCPNASITLNNLPRFSSRVRISGRPTSIEIVDLPHLLDLALLCPLPNQWELSGFPRLRSFVALGRRIDDQLLDELLRCPNLDDVTLAYASLSPAGCCRVGELTRLTGLSLPGCGIDDDIAASWTSLTRLRTVCLDDNMVGSETLAWLRSIPTLRRLSLSGNPLDQAAQRELAQLSQVADLSLAGCEISHRTLQSLIATGTLESLEMTGRLVPEELWNDLASGDGLKHLVLRDADVNVDQLIRTTRKNKHLNLSVHPDVQQRLLALDAALANRLHRLPPPPPFSATLTQLRDETIERRGDSNPNNSPPRAVLWRPNPQSDYL